MAAPFDERMPTALAGYRRLAGRDAPAWASDRTHPTFVAAYAAFVERPFSIDLGAHAGEEAMVRLGLKPMVRQILPRDDFERFEARWRAEGLQVGSQPLAVSEDPVSGYTFDQAQRARRAGRAAGAAAEDRWIDRVAADSQAGNKVLCYASEDAARIEEALRIDRELLVPGADERPRVARLGELLGYPPCCVEAFSQHRKLHHNRVAVGRSAARSERFDPLLNQLSLSLFHPIGWFPCRYDCPASLALARQLVHAMAGPMEPARDAALRMLSMPRLYWDDRRQVLLEGATPGQDAVRYTQVWTPFTFDRGADSADLDWLFFADVAWWLRSGDGLRIDGPELVLLREGAEVDRRPFDGLVLPFSPHAAPGRAAPDSGGGQVRGGIASLPVLHDGYLPEHLEEAVTVTTRGDATQLEIQLGHLCNNRCVFCVSGQLTQDRMAPPIELEPIVRALRDGAARGVTKLTFLGGEPTIQRSFLPALDAALELGYEHITIFTNGVRGRHERFLEEVCARGRFTWRLSIQGGNEAAHDHVTERPGSFAKILDALRHLRDLDQELTANLCVNERSYRSLPDFPELIEQTGVSQLHLDVIRPSGAGRRTDSWLRSIMPRFSDMAPYFARMLERFEERNPGYDVNVGNLPYCVMPEWAHQVHHGGEVTLTVAADQDRLDRVWNKYAFQASDMVFGEGCPTCVFWGQCRGVPAKYAEFYGTGELQPVSQEQLASVDPQRRNFAVLIRDHVARLEASTPPAPWRLERVFRDRRERRVELPMSGGGASATLVLEPHDESGAAVAAGPEFRLVLRPDGLTGSREQLAALLRWASRTLLATEPDLSVLQPSPAASLRQLGNALRALEAGDDAAARASIPAGLPPALRIPAARLQALAGDPVGALARLDALPPRLRPAADRLRVELCGTRGWNHGTLAALERLGTPVARRRAAALLDRNRDWRGALQQLEALRPWTQPEVAWKAAELASRLGEPRAAALVAEARAMRDDPLGAASLLASQGLGVEAEAALGASDSPEATLLRARLALFRLDLEAVRRLADDSAAGLALRGAAAVLEGSREAEALLDRALAADPDCAEAWIWRGSLRADRGEQGPALRDLEEGMRLCGGWCFAAALVHCVVTRRAARGEVAPGSPDRYRLTGAAGALPEAPPSGDGSTPDGSLDTLGPGLRALLPELGDPTPWVRDDGAFEALARQALARLGGNRGPSPTRLASGRLHPVPPTASPRHEARRVLEQIRVAPPEVVLAAFDALEQRFPRSSMPVVHRGELLLWMGRYDEALDDFARCLRLDPFTRWGYIGRLAAESMLGRPRRALEACDEGVRALRSTGPSQHVYRAEALDQLGRYGEALDEYERALRLNPTRLGAWFGLALARGRAGDSAGRDALHQRLALHAPALLFEAAHEGSVEDLLVAARARLRGNRSSSCITWFDRSDRLRLVPRPRPDAVRRAEQERARERGLSALRGLLNRLR